MKKIYSFILTALLLSTVGIGNAWGTNYCLKHPFNNGSWYWQRLTANGDGTYSCYGWKGDNSCDYIEADDAPGDGTNGTNLTITGDMPANGTLCKFTFTPGNNPTLTAVAYSGTYRSVTITTTNSAHLFVKDANGLKWQGAWPGGGWATSHEFSVIDGTELWATFNNNSDKRSAEIYLGAISTDKTFSISISSDNLHITSPYIIDSSTGWGVSYSNFLNNSNQITRHLTASSSDYEFKINYNDALYGYGTNGAKHLYTPRYSGEAWYVYTGDQDNIHVKPMYEGDYTIAFNSTNNTVTVTYPSTYTHSTLSSGQYGTICLPVTASSLKGADFYTIEGKRLDNENNPISIVLNSAGSTLTAGTPYFFIANGTNNGVVEMNLTTGSEDHYNASAGSVYGLIGTYVDYDFYVNLSTATDLYVVLPNKVQAVTPEGSGCRANHAYIRMGSFSEVETQAPGRREIILGENTTTSIEAIDANQNTLKYFENGQLRIVRDGVTYDAIGRIVK